MSVSETWVSAGEKKKSSYRHECPVCGAPIVSVPMKRGGWAHFEGGRGLGEIKHPCLHRGEDLSKRRDPVSVQQFREEGHPVDAMRNWLVRIGWSHGDQEIFSVAQMIELFDVADVNHAAARFDTEKLRWLNQQYLKNDDPAEVARHLQWHLEQAGYDLGNGPSAVDVVIALRERVHTLKEMAERARVWFEPLRDYDEAAVSKHLTATAAGPLTAVRERLVAQAEWTPAAVHDVLADTAQSLALGMGKIAQPLRVAITGTQVSPSIEHTIYLAGRTGALARIDAALALIARRAA